MKTIPPVNNMPLHRFRSWDSVDPLRIKECADIIASLSEAQIQAAIASDLKLFKETTGSKAGAFSVSKRDLLGVQNAAVTVKFKKGIEMGPGIMIGGMARLISVSEGYLPAIWITPAGTNAVEKHETIHLCQWLHDNPYPLTSEVVLKWINMPITQVLSKRAGFDADANLDYLIRWVCYKTRGELEAYYHAEGDKGAAADDILKNTVFSAQPFVTFEETISDLELDDDSAATNSCRQRFSEFCAAIESEVPWVRTLVCATGEKSLHDALFWRHDDAETDAMMGPLEDWLEFGFSEGILEDESWHDRRCINAESEKEPPHDIRTICASNHKSTKMMTELEAWDELYSYAQTEDAKSLGVTPEKVLTRNGSLIVAPDQPGKFIYTLERHRGIAGSTYTKGFPMTAYETYFLRLRFDPAEETLEKLSEEHVEYVFDFFALASEHLDCDSRPLVSKKASWKKKRRIDIQIGNFTLETSSLEEACKEVEELYKGWDLNVFFEDLEELSDEDKQKYIDRLSDAIVDQALGYVKNNWADPDLI